MLHMVWLHGCGATDDAEQRAGGINTLLVGGQVLTLATGIDQLEPAGRGEGRMRVANGEWLSG